LKPKQIKNPAAYLDEFSGDLSKTKKNGKKQEMALEKALDIRKFEIDLYWRRTAYFSAFITLAFGGYFEILKTPPDKIGFLKDDLLLAVSALGFILSVCWFFVNKASKHWQENWEHHVYLLEDEVMGPLYKTSHEYGNGKSSCVSPLKPYHYSISKINQWLSFVVVLVWLWIFTDNFFTLLPVQLTFFPVIISFKSRELIFLFVPVVVVIITIFVFINYCSVYKKEKGKNIADYFVMNKRVFDENK
jgi:hypothetical protein